MTSRDLQRLSDLLLKLFEETDPSAGYLRDEISHIRYVVEDLLEA